VTWLSDSAVSRLREVADWPDFTGSQYELLEKVGQGGMASVYVARDKDLERGVAIKVIHAPVIDPEVQERMLAEARIIAQLEHPGILPVHALGFLPDGRIYYVMKLVQGQRLDRFITDKVALSERLRVFLRICDATAFAHSKGIVHRDLKPSNVMIGEFGEVLVIDWGIAKVLRRPQPDGDALQATVLGTPGYMAPEQERGDTGSIDERTDVYSLGVLLGSLLPADASKSLRAIAEKARSPVPDDRYPDASELARDIQHFLSGDRITAVPESLLETAHRLVVRHRVFVVLVATYLVARVVLLVVAR
jgi:eukaryotic-like serine/threonine-protein kinase